MWDLLGANEEAWSSWSVSPLGSTLTREPPNNECRVALTWPLCSEIQNGYMASVLAPEAAYARVKNAWMKRGIW
uniref:Uncharacterized protein n=1 Tax=Bionectria ochroleuca TaxID=29856 RepID=A0A8H7TNF4_BIOOC